ncbi:MAG: sigma-54-dependent transcriptional regulator [Myxococcota bacterium]
MAGPQSPGGPPRVLVIDDDPSTLELVEQYMSGRGYEVLTRTGAEGALSLLERDDVDVVLTDLQLERSSGLALCERIVLNRPHVPVLVFTAYGSMESAVAAIRAGAYDFLTKPVDMQALGLALDRAVRHKELSEEVKRLRSVVGAQSAEEFVGTSPAMKRVYELVERVAEGQATVLITGESGTGKELVARAIHRRSPRANREFVALNCAAVPASLMEAELFGHLKGAFTDAGTPRQGLFLRADGGTIFLDEIAEMPLEMQAKLLRVLQDGRLRPVGGDQEVEVDARILAATNKDLEALVERGAFRDDLFYRINVVQIQVPPLRVRANDILLLAQYFVERFAIRANRPVKGLSASAAQRLLEYEWPGNVRELENSIERAVTLTPYDQVMVDDLPDKIRRYQSTHLLVDVEDPDRMPSLEVLETRYIRKVLKAVNGNKTRAAQVLGLDRRTLYRKLERIEDNHEPS